jgi:hypothetical protein
MQEGTEKRPYEKPVLEMCGSMIERTLHGNGHGHGRGRGPGCISGQLN